MSKAALIKAINDVIGTAYSAWTCGITNDPARRKGEHGNPVAWRDWLASSEEVAREVEKHFLDKGCKGGAGGGDNPKHIYVF